MHWLLQWCWYLDDEITRLWVCKSVCVLAVFTQVLLKLFTHFVSQKASYNAEGDCGLEALPRERCTVCRVIYGNSQIPLHRVGLEMCDEMVGGIGYTVLMKGGTGTGKTFTAFGTAEQPGLLQILVTTMAEQRAENSQSEFDYNIRVIEVRALHPNGPLKVRDLVPEEPTQEKNLPSTSLNRFMV